MINGATLLQPGEGLNGQKPPPPVKAGAGAQSYGTLTFHKIAADDPLIATVLADLRPRQQVELRATAWTDNLAEYAQRLAMFCKEAGHVTLIAEAGQPRAVLSLVLVSPGFAVVGLIATSAWDSGLPRALYRWLKCRYIPRMFVPELRRVQCDVIEGSDIRWLERLGFGVEGAARHIGKHGETFIRLAWINPARSTMEA